MIVTISPFLEAVTARNKLTQLRADYPSAHLYRFYYRTRSESIERVPERES